MRVFVTRIYREESWKLRNDIFWLILVHSRSLWFFMVHHGFIMAHSAVYPLDFNVIKHKTLSFKI